MPVLVFPRLFLRGFSCHDASRRKAERKSLGEAPLRMGKLDLKQWNTGSRNGGPGAFEGTRL